VFDVRDLLKPTANSDKPPEQRVTELLDLIKTTVAPDSWRDAGGTVGSIRELNGQLIIIQTLDNDATISQILNRLHEARAAAPPASQTAPASQPATTRAAATADPAAIQRENILTLYVPAKRPSHEPL